MVKLWLRVGVKIESGKWEVENESNRHRKEERRSDLPLYKTTTCSDLFTFTFPLTIRLLLHCVHRNDNEGDDEGAICGTTDNRQ